ncbi:MAG: glycosyltransferase family 4 protein [Dehalococcoidia bacterium]|nr:glycosyltransferase family 4 protein [Dehalococcoidia bacterium]
MEVFIVEATDAYSPRIGGGETYSVNLFKYLLEIGVRTVFIGASSSGSRVDQEDLSFIPVASGTHFSNIGYTLRLLTSQSFKRVHARAVVNVQHPMYALPFVMFCPTNPMVITLHGRVLHGVRLKQPRIKAVLYQIIESLCLRRCAAVIAVDAGTKDFYVRQYPWLSPKIRVIPIGIDLARFKTLDRQVVRAKWGFGDDERIVMFAGRLEVEKDLGFLIESFRAVLTQVPQARLVFVGDGKDRKQLEDMAKDLTPKSVLFLGAQKPESMPEILNCADVLALCSLYEGSPTIVKEALACGVPVVSTLVGDVAEVIRNSLVGRIVPKETGEYSRAIVEFLSKTDREGTRRECVKVASEFAFDLAGKRTVELYEELLHGMRGTGC